MQYAIFDLSNLEEPIYMDTPEDNEDINVSRTKQI